MKKEINYKKILKYTLIFTLVISAFILLTTSQTVLADVGNNNSYDTGSSGSSGDSDNGIWILYIIFDLFGPVGGLIVLGVIIVIFLLMKKSGKLNQIQVQQQNNMVNEQAMMSQNMNNNGQSQAIANNIRQNDPNFSEDAFIGWTREVFMKIQQAWNDRNWKVIKKHYICLTF